MNSPTGYFDRQPGRHDDAQGIQHKLYNNWPPVLVVCCGLDGPAAHVLDKAIQLDDFGFQLCGVTERCD